MLWAAGIGRAAYDPETISMLTTVLERALAALPRQDRTEERKNAAGIKHPRGSRQGGARPPTALRHGTGRRPLGACHWGGSCFPAH